MSSETQAAATVALDLLDPTPREVVVLFEISPRELPAQTKVQFSQEFTATVEPGARASEVRVVIPARTVERYLLGSQEPIPDSFSDFVWTFDVETGHVVSAKLHGRVAPRLDWGFMTTQTEADISIEMGTARIGGFKRPRHVLGQLVFSYCSNPEDEHCRMVATTPFERATGYVNAIGEVWVHSSITDLWNFSPMGEAIFREIEQPGRSRAGAEVVVGSMDGPAVVALPALADAPPVEPERRQ